MTETSTSPELEYPINQELLENATQAKEEWRVIKDRLAKIEDQKEEVTEAVYKRVRDDYEGRLTEATTSVLERKEEIDGELTALYETRKTLSGQLEEHQHKLEEIKFRNSLGEFTEEEYQSAAKEEQDKISKFETILGAVEGNIARYEAIFEGEDELFAPQETQVPIDVAEADTGAAEVSGLTDEGAIEPAPHEREPVTDAGGFVVDDEGPDYFSAPKGAGDTTSPEIETSSTERKIPSPGMPKAEENAARLVIVNGPNAGTAYPLKGTLSIGRAESSTITLHDAKVSRQHAQVQKQGNEYVFVDLNSSNGSYVNGQRVEEYVLANGDEIGIGDTTMHFEA